MYKWIIACMVVLTLSGCGEKTIDTSDDESLKDSVSDIRSSLSEDKLKKFDEAIKIVMFKDLDLKNFMLGANVGGALELSKAKSNLDGKSADEIINEAITVKENRLIKQKEDLEKQIRELEDKELLSLEFENQIIISNEKIYEEKERFRTNKVVEFDMINNSSYTISSISIKGKFLTEDREVPWSEITLSHNIAGGILSNESRNIKIKFTMYSYKGMKLDEIPSNAKLKVVLDKIYDDKNVKIYPIDGFNEYDKQRLNNLIHQYQEL